MKDWIKYTYNPKEHGWFGDRPTAYMQAIWDEETKQKFWREKYTKPYDKMREDLVKTLNDKIDMTFEEVEKDLNMNIAVTNVVTFRYLNAGQDQNPVVLVTGVSDEFIWGYNLNYYKADGLMFRKYSRSSIIDLENLTEQAIDSQKPKPKLFAKDLKIGQKFKFLNACGAATFVVYNIVGNLVQIVALTTDKGNWFKVGELLNEPLASTYEVEILK